MSGTEVRRTTKQVGVRLPHDLLAAIEADAEANGRNIAQTIRYHLRAALSARRPCERCGGTDCDWANGRGKQHSESPARTARSRDVAMTDTNRAPIPEETT